MTTQKRPTLEENQTWADKKLVQKLLPTREIDAHKWSAGGLVVVAGSPSYPGAEALTARAAGRAGAGVVALATPRSVVSTIVPAIPEVVYIPLSESESLSGSHHTMTVVSEQLAKSKAIAIGPGLGKDEASAALLQALFGAGRVRATAPKNIGFASGESSTTADEEATEDSPIFAHEGVQAILDADALNWLATQDEWWKMLPEHRAILTPHPGEMGRLLDKPVDEILSDPAKTVQEAAKTWKQTVLLKSGYSVASDGDRVIVAEDAPAALATAGSGDTLTGIIGAFAAQGLSGLDAVALALYVGPRAARRVEQEMGTLGVIATDLPDAIASELRDLAKT